MKILVVSHLFSAVRDAIEIEGACAKGMPGFLKAMKFFTENGVKIDYIFTSKLSSDKKFLTYESKVDYIKKEQIKDVVIKNARINRYTKSVPWHFQLKSAVKKVLKENNYDFIYAMTPDATCINELANSMGIPCGVRFYGTFLWSFYQKNGYKKAKFVFSDEIKNYNLPKSFMLITDDGSNGIDSYEKFCNNKSLYDFYYWKNGVDRIELNDEKKSEEAEKTLKKPALLYVATITGWKRHDRAIEVIKILKDRGVECNLYFAGSMPETEIKWKTKLDDMIEEYGVKDNVTFLGSLDREEFLYLSKVAVACPLFQDTTNMGNVFHELLSAGAVIVSLNDGSLDDYIENGKNGFLVNNMEDAADIIEKLIKEDIDSAEIRCFAAKTSREKMISWDERFKKELDLIRNAIGK